MNKLPVHFFWLALFVLLCSSTLALADTVPPATGTPPLSTVSSGPFDDVDLANLDVHFSIPIFSRPGIGKPFTYSLTYDSLNWVPFNSQGAAIWTPAANWGWRAQTDAATGYVTYAHAKVTKCYYFNEDRQHTIGGTTTDYTGFVYHDAAGGVHGFSGQVEIILKLDDDPKNNCANDSETWLTNALTTDNSGYVLSTDATIATVNAPDGSTIQTPQVGSVTGSGLITDANNNAINISVNGSTTTLKDTLGTTALTIIGTPPSPPCSGTVQYQYAAPGATAKVTVTYSNYWVQTNFNASGISELPATNSCLVDKVILPDGTFYSFTYETTVGPGISGKTTGLIASITLPTYWTINYSYAGTGCGNNSNCMMADGSPSAMQRTYAQYGGTWTYTRRLNPNGNGNPQFTQTTVVDPANNETDYSFNGVYETLRSTYQGRANGGTLLDQEMIAYNDCLGSCDTTPLSLPITSKHYNDIPSGDYNHHLRFDYNYNNGLVVSETDRDFGNVGAVLRTIKTNYNTALCSSRNICDRPDYVMITDGQGTQVGYTTYGYDEGGSTHGMVTSIYRSVSGNYKGPFLGQHYTYNANGTLKTATDPKGTVTDYSAGGYLCNGAFPNQVTVAGLTTSYGYDCRGGVVLTVTDSNGAGTKTAYTDPYYWRPASSVDALNNTTYYNYYGANNSGDSAISLWSQVESVMKWNGGNSVTDKLTQLDGYGRIYLEQTREAPGSGNWDTTNYFYDSSGRLLWLARPVVAAAAQHSGGGIPATGYWYDGLGRLTETKDWSGLDITYSYNANDVKIIKGGGQTFSKQLEYDSLGRLTSVCELSNSLPGVGGCSQNTDPGSNGYRTVYSYDANGNLSAVQQNVQGQTVQNRSFTYDGLSRLTKENNPESGVTSYQYDTPSQCWEPQSPGDLTEKSNANVTICYWYDALHRLTDVGNTHQGPDNPCLRFRYDNSSGYTGHRPSGINPTYTMGRLVEAATDECDAQDPILADEWFSYSATGDTTDLWESTPHSGGWYHTQSGYAPNGAIWARGGFLGTGTTTRFTNGLGYVVDGEGRLNGLWDQSLNQSVWWGTTYNPAGQPDRVAFYNGDYETFSWDQASGRMSQWKSVVGSNSQTGNLNWSANGTLYQLAISDTADTANRQTCINYYDDLGRLSQNSCGSARADQWFTYDAFGNIKKTGSDPFTPSYGSNNRITGSGFSYDAVGNVTNDGSNIYSYSVGGRPVKVNNLTLVNDAFDRTVEIHGQAYHDFVYAPDGWRLGRMSGQTVEQVYAPLAGGLQAVYGAYSSGKSQVLYWRHSDWLGSSRLASTPGRTVYFDGAYAPYAENYAGIGTSDRSFTGKTMDSGAGGIYDFPMRQYSQTQGRWNTPDPAGLSAADPTDPQTLNRYAYVGNNPLSNVDALGLYKNVIEDTTPSYWDIWGNLFAGSHPSAEITLKVFDDTHPRHTYTPITITVDGGKPPEVPPIPVTFTNTIPFVTLPNIYPVAVYGCGHGDDCSNGNTVPGYSPQDGICSSPADPLNASPEAMACCAKHDRCYAEHGCNATSWKKWGPWSGACQRCNMAAGACVGGALLLDLLKGVANPF